MGRTQASADLDARRRAMVKDQIAGRGIEDPRVLDAMRTVPRERFVPEPLLAHAFDDCALPIASGQTISQPYMVALMAAAAELRPGDRVLEVGTGSGYAAAVFSRIAGRVYTVERHAPLAAEASTRFRELGYDNIEVSVHDGSLGWPEHAPYDAIIVAAGAPERVPQALLEQLAPRGRLIIPRGATLAGQDLVRIRRDDAAGGFREEVLDSVRFVPLIGSQGWREAGNGSSGIVTGPAGSPPRLAPLAARIADGGEWFERIDEAPLNSLLTRIGDARLVLIGEASHGTSEFYRMRARITRELIERSGFDFVAVEADWPDAAWIDAWVRLEPDNRRGPRPFQRFPRWMWANTDVMAFVHWLRAFNEAIPDEDAPRRVGFHGLDLYSMHASIEAVLAYLGDVDPEAARVARRRYACLTPWQNDPILYGRAVLGGTFDECEDDVVATLGDLLAKRLEYARRDGSRFFDAVQNARLVASAERYYRTLFRGSVSSWNLRDRHMFETLLGLLDVYGSESRGIVWAHNSHLGDASATAMAERGELNVGQLVRARFGTAAWLIGFGTHAGTVAAARDWDEPVEVMQVRPSHPRSYEHLAHESGVPRFVLPLRSPAGADLRRSLLDPRLERAIGVIYRPETELQSHYFTASLPRQFDEWIWFHTSSAVTPIGEAHREELAELPDTFPFGL